MADRCFCCCVDEITADMALCYHKRELQQFYSCDTPFQLVYSCDHAEKFTTNPFIGQQICAEEPVEDGIIAGRFYADTDLETHDVRLSMTGTFKNPEIEINGNVNIIKGEYDGSLIIKPSGDVYYMKGCCCEPELLDPKVWVIPKGNVYGWTIYPQVNSIYINANNCCSDKMMCVYVDIDNITI